ATPVGGALSSFEYPEKWNWDLELFNTNSTQVLLSNRLYRFEFNPKRNTGVPFDIGIEGAKQIRIRVFSPIWPDTIGTYVLKVQ
ncbi:MAG TPA: hypothetical protein VN917_03860, partial [Xanthobacteraceae bacterium]|nr:hypothetical protein [Xanthobacteraceae bacterium]